jgi:deoxycytidine triphosphate deaminase
VKAAKPDKAEKNRKPKLVRDSFTIPKNEFVVLEALKLRAAKLGRPVKKSEVLRAGVMALAGMGDAAFLASVTSVPAVKTGRPAKTAA